jgi:hypothetical protein
MNKYLSDLAYLALEDEDIIVDAVVDDQRYSYRGRVTSISYSKRVVNMIVGTERHGVSIPFSTLRGSWTDINSIEFSDADDQRRRAERSKKTMEKLRQRVETKQENLCTEIPSGRPPIVFHKLQRDPKLWDV